MRSKGEVEIANEVLAILRLASGRPGVSSVSVLDGCTNGFLARRAAPLLGPHVFCILYHNTMNPCGRQPTSLRVLECTNVGEGLRLALADRFFPRV